MALRAGGRSSSGHDSRSRPLVSGRVVVLLLALGAAWWLLATPLMGGQTTYVATGAATPGYPPGGLLLVRELDGYAVGELVVHRTDSEGEVSISRVVAGDGTRLHVDEGRGANGHTLSEAEVVGVPWIHLPKAAVVVRALSSPVGFGLSIVLLVALTVGVGRGGSTPSTRNLRRPTTRLLP